MQFELTEALIDQILFAMEDQKTEHLLDAANGVVVDLPAGDASDPGTEIDREEENQDGSPRYISLPGWLPADGFRLMERFSASLHNPIVREELVSALDRGRGVFRAFKDVLSARPEVERLWFSFKEREMRREILEWYNALREEWGLERLGEEPEETEDLVLEDFRFRSGTSGDAAAAAELLALCRDQFSCRDAPVALSGPALRSVVAETSRDDFAGFVLAELSGGIARISWLDVHPHYRGLGVGEKLLDRVLSLLAEDRMDDVLIDLPEGSAAFSRVLYRHGFAVYETRFALNLKRRRSEEG
jgi:ribosomal protein S18 acetylase RimI-like enzyme